MSVSLCRTCARVRFVETGRSTFLLCGLAREDPRFAKYPPQPVIACPGYARSDADPPGRSAGPARDDDGSTRGS